MCFLGIEDFSTVLVIRSIGKAVLNTRLGCMLGGYVCWGFIIKAVLLSVLNLRSIFYCFALCFSTMTAVC
jgi:hypothetical protein